MEIKTTKKIIGQQDKLWRRRDNSNPAFKPQGQTEFTYDNYNKLVEEADKFNKVRWVAVDEVNEKVEELKNNVRDVVSPRAEINFKRLIDKTFKGLK